MWPSYSASSWPSSDDDENGATEHAAADPSATSVAAAFGAARLSHSGAVVGDTGDPSDRCRRYPPVVL